MDAAHPFVIFGEVDQLEIIGEGADEHFGLIGRDARDERRQPETGIGIARAEVLAEGANILFQRESVRAGLALNHFAEQTAKR